MSEPKPVPTRDVPATDDAYLLSEKAQHERDIAVNKSDNDRLVRIEQARAGIEQTRAGDRSHRRQVAAWLLGTLLVAATIAAIAWIVADSHQDDELTEIRIEQERAKVASACIQAGNIWVDGDCLITRK